MNYRYIPSSDGALRRILERAPAASLHEIRASHPSLQSMSVDHLSLRIDQMALSRDAWPGRAHLP